MQSILYKSVPGTHNAVRLNGMSNTGNQLDHFSQADRKVLIESAILIEMTRKDVVELKADGPKSLELVRSEARSEREKLELRVRVLENFRWWLLGAVAVVSPVMSALTSWLVSRLH